MRRTEIHLYWLEKIVLVTAFLLAMGAYRVAEPAGWALDADSIPQPPGSKVIELYSKEETMGPSGKQLVVPQADVQIPTQVVLAPTASARAAGGVNEYYLVRIPFTLHPLSGDRKYQSLRLEVKLNGDTAIGLKLIPTEVVTSEDVQRLYDVSLLFGSEELNMGVVGKVSRSISTKRIYPVVHAFGESSASFYWLFEQQATAPPLLGSKYTVVILRVPKGTKSVTGAIQAEAIVDSRYPWRSNEELLSDPLPFTWKLDTAESIDKIPTWSLEKIE